MAPRTKKRQVTAAAVNRTNASLPPDGIVQGRGQVVGSVAGRLVHSRCPAVAKARPPRRVVWYDISRNTRVWTLEDCSCRHLVTLTSWQSSDSRYRK